MTETQNSQFPVMQRDYAPGEVIEETVIYQMHIQDEDGRWMPWLTPDTDRDKMTRIQTHRLLDTEHHGERRRIIGRRIIDFVDEVEGDGEGETSADELIARNQANTERLMKTEDKQPGT